MSERKEHNRETTLSIGNAVAWFGAHTASTSSTVRFYNANGYGFMVLKSGDVSKRFESLFDERLVGTCHAEDGRLYAILKDDDCTREEPVGFFPFADVQVGSNCEFGRRISAVAVAVEYGPALL